MKSFHYTVQSVVGLHARPASQLIMAARSYQSDIAIEKGSRMANPKSLMSVLALNVSQGDEILVTAEGADEAKAIEGLKKFMSENL